MYFASREDSSERISSSVDDVSVRRKLDYVDASKTITDRELKATFGGR